MSKKRLAASLLVVLFGILANILVFRYEPVLSEKKVTVKVTLTSDEENYMEMFYLTDGQKMPDDFRAEQSGGINYKNTGKEEVLDYSIPANTSYFRLDFGSGKSETTISGIEVVSNGNTMEVPPEEISNLARLQEVKKVDSSEETVLRAEKEDPYAVWDTQEWGLTSFVRDSLWLHFTIVKVLACLVLDIILVVIIKCGKKLIVLPKEVYQNRKLLWNLSKNDFKTKFAGSYLGIIWAFIQPIVTVVVYWFVFEKGLKAGGINTRAGIDVPFVLWLVAGLVPWFFFQDALNGGTNALIEYSYLVKKVVFKISILPIVKVVSALFVHVFFVVFTLVLYSAYHYYPDLYTLQIVYYTFAMFIMVLGIVYATCAIVIFFRDLTQVINIVLQVGMWMTPIMWNIDTMELSPVLITIFKLNPMYYIVAGYRDALINKAWFWENAPLTLYFWLLTAVLFGIGTMIFKRLKIHFADVL